MVFRSPMRPVDLIRKKRDGGEHSAKELSSLVEAFTRGEVPDYQMSAWMMAVLLRGMSSAETAALTEAMMRSGSLMDLSELPGVKVDKHSTGGVGDKTSLILAPIVAAGGLTVPMISRRGLGHTGGVGDKTSLILAPIVAAGGLTVPMISGRGLGHTGGTLDKLESIHGFHVNLSLDRFR